ncbi:MAG: TIGR03667 family PPOX class F420-dependent oxidoreductase [Candidatus Sericytochromatia bacterium]
MAAEFTQEVVDRLNMGRDGWLTTVAKSGQPVPRLVWFFFDGAELTVYSMPNAAKVAHIKAHPRVSFNLDSDGEGGGVVAVGGEARVEAVDVDPVTDKAYQDKYADYARSLGFTEEFLSAFNTRLKISIDKVWTTPTAE